MQRRYDTIIVGAGPAGCSAAYDLAAAGYSVLLLDRRKFPRVKPCAGALTIKAIKALRYSIAPVVRQIATDFAAGKGMAEVNVFRGSRPICALTVRSEFDLFCLHRTIEAGAEFKTISYWTSIEQLSDTVAILTSEGVFRARFLIGADGANSQVRRLCVDAGWALSGFALEVDCENPGNQVNLEFDFGIVDGGYGWIFPKRDHVNVGLFTYKSGKLCWRDILDAYRREKLGTSAIGPVKGHEVGLGGKGYTPAQRRVLLVGDAAGLVDALLGEGIYNAIRSGQAAAAAIREELENGTPAPAAYSKRLRRIQNDAAACQRAAMWFYNDVDAGYAALTSPLIRYATMKGYAMGLTFSATKRWYFLLPLLPVQRVNGLAAAATVAEERTIRACAP